MATAAEKLSYDAPVNYENITWFIATQDKEIVDWFRSQRKRGKVVWYEGKTRIGMNIQSIAEKEQGS